MTTLRDARLELHYAARLLASAAHALLPHAADDSHSALTLGNDGEYLETPVLNGKGLTLCLVLHSLQLEWRLSAHVRDSLSLAGQRMDDGYAWLNRTRSPDAPLIREREFPDFPEHTLAASGRFSQAGAAERAKLSAEFGAGHAALRQLLASVPHVSPLRLWPHHFDLGALVTLDAKDHMVGLGFSPGDDSYDEPYYYVSPYPQPNATSLPVWHAAGHWHTDGFTALILTATERDASGPSVVASFLAAALAATRSLVS